MCGLDKKEQDVHKDISSRAVRVLFNASNRGKCTMRNNDAWYLLSVPMRDKPKNCSAKGVSKSAKFSATGRSSS